MTTRRRELTEDEINDLVANPPPEVEQYCIPGNHCPGPAYRFLPPGRLGEQVSILLKSRGLEPTFIFDGHYLLPVHREFVALLNGFQSSRNPIYAVIMNDWLLDHGFLVPPFIKAISVTDRTDKTTLASKRTMVSNVLRNAEYRKMSNAHIGRHLNCSRGVVRRLRAKLFSKGEP